MLVCEYFSIPADIVFIVLTIFIGNMHFSETENISITRKDFVFNKILKTWIPENNTEQTFFLPLNFVNSLFQVKRQSFLILLTWHVFYPDILYFNYQEFKLNSTFSTYIEFILLIFYIWYLKYYKDIFKYYIFYLLFTTRFKVLMHLECLYNFMQFCFLWRFQ